VDTGTAANTTVSPVATSTVSSKDATPTSLPVPVSNGHEGMWDTTTTTGRGPADLYCSVLFAASRPKDFVSVSLFNDAGEWIDRRAGMPCTFVGLQPGKYRLSASGEGTGYISQWYGGLPVQGHDVSESQVLELKPGRNVAEFVLQPGLSIQGEVSWTQGTPLGGYIQVYDLQRRDTGGGTAIGGGMDPMQAGTRYQFLIVGLLPGRYRMGASFDTNDLVPQVWGGGGSFEDAPVIDLTSGDVAAVRVELGALPTTTTTGGPE
jgi:hypothetical protein